jgi:hypothetical protein
MIFGKDSEIAPEVLKPPPALCIGRGPIAGAHRPADLQTHESDAEQQDTLIDVSKTLPIPQTSIPYSAMTHYRT